MIDAHAHYQQEPFEEAKKLLGQAFGAGVEKIALGGTHPADWKAQVQLHHLFPEKIFMHFGLHPWWVEKYSLPELEKILIQLDHELPLVHGLGETGLDYYPTKRDPSRFEDQRWMFREQIRLAVKHQKPLVLHVVQAHPEALRILIDEEANRVPLILHRFSGNEEQAKEYLKLGAFLCFHETKKWMKDVPVSQLLLETDSNPKQHPGGWDIRPHYQKTAEIMELSLAELIEKVAENFGKIGYSRAT